MNLRAWLRPGLGVKRWLLVVFVGELGLALAGALALRQVYREVEVGGPLQGLIYVLTLQFLPYAARAVILGAAGIGLFVGGSLRLVRSLTDPLRGGADQPLVEVIYQKRFLARGPRIVAIGGGTGLSTLLRGLKEHSSNITAIVTVADDGGSSGMLRETLGIPAVGDIRNCIVALADQEPLMADLLQYRFPSERGATSSVDASPEAPDRANQPDQADRRDGLAGHAIGNLLLAAMTAVEGGDFEDGVRQMNRVLAVRGQVLPVSPTPLTLRATLRDGSQIVGQSVIARTSGIDRVAIEPETVKPSDGALQAIAEADLIVLGPGSLFTSVLPSLLVPQIRDAVLASAALCVYVCNVATQHGETTGFDLVDHVEALVRHTAPGIADAVLANNRFDARTPEGWHAEPVRLRWPPAVDAVPQLVLEDVVDPANAHHHAPTRLASALVSYAERAGASRRRGTVARTA